MFSEPVVDYGTISASLFASADPSDILLGRVEALAQRSPVIVALVSDEEPERITLLKNPRRFSGSLANPSPLDSLIYGFAGSDSRTLAAVHIPANAFEISAAYNVLDDATLVRAGLDLLPPDQTFHPYVNAGTPDMTNAGCRRALVLPMIWYEDLASHPEGIDLKLFYDSFLATVPAAERPIYVDVFTWWRHAASREPEGDRVGDRAFRSRLPKPLPRRCEPPAKDGRVRKWSASSPDYALRPHL
jgi:hypothetical protein